MFSTQNHIKVCKKKLQTSFSLKNLSSATFSKRKYFYDLHNHFQISFW
jgi:hypothetical protein